MNPGQTIAPAAFTTSSPRRPSGAGAGGVISLTVPCLSQRLPIWSIPRAGSMIRPPCTRISGALFRSTASPPYPQASPCSSAGSRAVRHAAEMVAPQMMIQRKPDRCLSLPPSRSRNRQTCPFTRKQVEQGHPNGHTIRDLFLDDRLITSRNVRCDLDSLVHRAGMHHQRTGARAEHPFPVDLVQLHVFAQAGEKSAILALALDAQGHYDVSPLDAAVEVMANLNRRQACPVPIGPKVRHQCWRTTQDNPGSHPRKAPDVGTRYPAVQDVADD